MDTLVRLESVSVSHRQQAVLEDVSLEVNRREIVTLIGPNGAGKSTLVRVALGLEKPVGGRVWQDAGLRTGYVPQSVDPDPTMPLSVARFLALGGHKDASRPQEVLDLVGASGLADKPLSRISGGELRRVLVARALLGKPNLLILDEPTSGVDIGGQGAIYDLVGRIRDSYGCGVLLVSHNLHVVMAATDRVLCLNRHVCCTGTPEHVRNHPEFVSLFGRHSADTLGIYRHTHDHVHVADGSILPGNQDLHRDCDHG